MGSLAVVLPLVALAAEASPEIVVTANRSPQPVAETGRSVTVIDAQEIRARQTLALGDLIATVPGVVVTRAGGFGGVSSVFIRGAEAQQTLLLVDGVKLDDPASPGGGYDFGNLAVGAIERVEIVRGAQSVIWGSRAIGGVVQALTRAPGEAPRLELSIEGGGRGTANAVARASAATGPVALSANARFLTTDGFSQFAGGAEADGHRSYGAGGRATVAVSDAVSLDLRGSWNEARTRLDGFPPPNYSFGDTGDFSTDREWTGYAGLNAAMLDGRWRNRLAIEVSRIDRVNFDATGAATFASRGENRRFEYQGTIDVGAGKAVFGAESERSRFAAESFGFGSSAHATLNGVYGEVTVRPVAAAALTAGVRHDDHSRFGGATVAAANGVVTLGGTTLRASYGEGFGAPSLYQLFGDYGNAALRPERSASWDAGLTHRLLGGAIEIQASYFHRLTRDQIDFVSCFGVAGGICVNRPFGTYDNVRATRAEGVEATLAIAPAAGSRVALGYTHLVARDRVTGRRLARRPSQTLSLVADARLPRGASIGATVLLMGDSFDDAANARPVDGHVTVDLRASLPLTQSLELFGRIENVFDARYESVLGYGTARRGAFAGLRARL